MPQKKETTDRAPPSRAPGSAQPLAVLAGMSETGPHTLPKDLALEGGEHGQQRSHCTTRRSGQVERLGQRHEANAEMLKFMQSRIAKFVRARWLATQHLDGEVLRPVQRRCV